MNDLIVDGNSLFARCWFAVKEDAETALRLSVISVLQLLDQEHDGRIKVPISRTLFGWDGTAKTDKKREPKPQIYLDTRYRFQEVLLTLFNTIHGYHQDYEADDVVATAVFNSTARQIYVVSGDKDLMQLQGGNVAFYDLCTKVIMSPRNICRKFGIKQPSQIPLAQAITGDSGDGIGGIPKWGPKKVERLFEWVTDKMDFGEALYVVKRQIPEELMKYFMDALDKTLLHTELEGIPDPSPLKFCDPEEVRLFGIYGIAQAYDRIAMQYEDRRAVLTSMIKGSRSESPRLRPDQSSV